MLEKWFKDDINKLFQKTYKIVLIDIEGNYDFLVETIDKEADIKVFKVDDYLSDLEVKYRVEKEFPNSKILIHTNLKINEADNRQYMIQEYAACGSEFSRLLDRYIIDKSDLRDSKVKLSKDELIISAKMSLKAENNNQEFWNNIKIQGNEAILGQFEEVVLRFLAEPEVFIRSLPNGGRKHLYKLIGEYIDYAPEEDTAPTFVAAEFANKLFLNIIIGN
ncbi:MAG: hypothetical protein ACOCRK_07750, partial [bacterium]